jgi:hypothetical protein
MEAGPEHRHLRALIESNTVAKDQEQEAEVVASIEELRWYGLRVERKPYHEGFGIELEFVPRLTPGWPEYTFAEVVLIKVCVCGCAW